MFKVVFCALKNHLTKYKRYNVFSLSLPISYNMYSNNLDLELKLTFLPGATKLPLGLGIPILLFSRCDKVVTWHLSFILIFFLDG
jgi:hypothetical protein